MSEYCLGLEILNTCTYDPATPSWRILTLGDTITAVALVIAFSQLLTRTLKYRVHHIFAKVYLLWGLGALCVVFASILPILPGDAVPVLGYPIFWEFCGAAAIIGGITWLIVGFNRRMKFSARTATDVISTLVGVLATGEETDHAELARELTVILPELIKSTNLHDSFEAEFARREERTYTSPDIAWKAGKILQICSDQLFCSVVVRRAPVFAIVLFEEIKKQNAYRNHFAKPLIRELARQALLNPTSILYREEKASGLGFIHGFTKSAFSDSDFVEHILPLSSFSPILEKNVEIKTLNRYGEILEELLAAYLKSQRFYEHSFSVYSSFNSLLEYANYIASNIDDATCETLYNSYPYQVLRSVSRTIKRAIELMEKDPNLLNEKLIEFSKKVQRNRDLSPFEYAADWMFSLMKSTARTRKYDQQIRDICYEPWIQFYPFGQQTKFHEEIQWRLQEKILSQLKENLEGGFYPAVTRPLICILGLYESSKGPENDARFRTEFYDYLKSKFYSLYKSNQKRALDKLPEGVVFDEENMRLIQQFSWSDDRIISLKNDGNASEGVNSVKKNTEEEKTVIKTEQTSDSFETWASKPFVSDLLRPKISTANILLTPVEQIRNISGPVFPTGTEQLWLYLRKWDSDQIKAEIAIDDDKYEEYAFHGVLINIANFVVSDVAAPLLVLKIYEFLQEKNTESSTEVRCELTIVRPADSNIKISYSGPSGNFEMFIKEVNRLCGSVLGSANDRK